MDRDEIKTALTELGQELERKGVTARIYLVGGAAMVLAYNNRFSTDDVDVNLVPTDDVVAVAVQVGSRLGLREDWLDSHLNMHIPSTKEPEWNPVMRFGSVEVAVADARSLLAMKIRASRGRRDEADLEFLLEECRIPTWEDAVQLYEQYFPEDEPPPQARVMVEEALKRIVERHRERGRQKARAPKPRKRPR